MNRKYDNKKGKLDEKQKALCAYHAEMCQVFSHPTRLEILCALREHELSVGELAETLGLGMGNLSQHLAMMRERRILEARKAGNQVFYRVANPKLLKAFDLLREILLDQVAEQSRLLTGGRT